MAALASPRGQERVGVPALVTDTCILGYLDPERCLLVKRVVSRVVLQAGGSAWRGPAREKGVLLRLGGGRVRHRADDGICIGRAYFLFLHRARAPQDNPSKSGKMLILSGFLPLWNCESQKTALQRLLTDLKPAVNVNQM